MRRKKVFKLILAALAILMLILPFMVSINDVMTRVIEKIGWYLWIQERITPWEVRMVAGIVKPLGLDFKAYTNGFTVNNIYAKLSWNCLGWQSLVLLLISLPFGFKIGNYTLASKLEAILIGLAGVFFSEYYKNLINCNLTCGINKIIRFAFP